MSGNRANPDEAFEEGEAPRPPRPPRPVDRERPRRSEREDDDDDRRARRRRPRRRDDDNVLSTLIPYKNGQALAAYYCGVFSLIPVIGVLLGPIAIIMGIMGHNYARAHPEAKGAGHAITGIVLGSVGFLVCGLGPVVFVVLGLASGH